MKKELHDYLDGRTGSDDLSAHMRGDAAAWDALVSDVRAAGADGAPVGIESRVMSEIRAKSRQTGWKRVLNWSLSPRPVLVRPLLGFTALAALVVVAVTPMAVGVASRDARLPEPDQAASALVGEEVVYVQFVLDAPDARSVHIAGDFSGWEPTVAMSDVNRDGRWSGRVRLPPGLHKYMFVIDGETWITDPNAVLYAVNRNGERNAAIAVTGGAGTGSLAP